MKNMRCVVLSLGMAVLLGAGCSTYKNQSGDMRAAWIGGKPAVAAKAFSDKADHKDNTKDSVVWHLEAGAAYRAAGDYTNSNRHLEAAADRIDKYEEQAKVKVGREAAAIMSNQQNLPYEGKSYDKIMLHTYKALNYLALGDAEKARPEVIRAYQRQQDAVDENARRIEKSKEDEANAKEKDKVEKAKADPKFASALEGVTKDIEGFKFYADYVNPFTVYLDGLFFLYAGSGGSDLERANKSLKRVSEVCPDNKFVQADLAAATNALAGQMPGPCTYVVFETGQAASLGQVRIDIPIIVVNVSYVGAAFPKLEFHNDHAREFIVKTVELQETAAPLASMDSIVALDFKNEFPVIVTKTVISTVAKAAAAYAVNTAASQQSEIAGWISRIGTAVAQAAVNIADTRTWTTLPKEFHIVRISTPADRKLTLSTGGCAPVDMVLMDGAVNVVYVKSIAGNSPLLVSQFKLK